MTRTPPITDAEWEVMSVLWERSPATALEVIEAVREKMDWHPKTVKTLLARLVKKGILRYRTEGNRYVYTPAIARQRYVRDESKSFVARVFGGDPTPALMHFVRTTNLSEDDIEELRRLLDEKRERKS